MEVAALVPQGRVTSYGAIARYLGFKNRARMVGWAMNQAGNFPKVPAHRVVNSAGQLTGKAHFNPPEKMEQLLLEEGVEVKSDKIQNFKKVFWDPSEELI